MRTLEQRDITVRKARLCLYCGERIESGERAHTWVNVDGGQLYRGYVHPECVEPMDANCLPDEPIAVGAGERPKQQTTPAGRDRR